MGAQKGCYLKPCTKCTYTRHIAIKHEVDVHEVGDEDIEKYMYSNGLRVYVFKSNMDQESSIKNP